MDKTLNDGTNMENTGTLPTGFTVYDKTTRALMYTVKQYNQYVSVMRRTFYFGVK